MLNEALENFKIEYPILFKKLLHIVNLTRAFQFKYQYMGCLIMDQDPANYSPNFVHGSVLRLYINELHILKDDQDSQVLIHTFAGIRNVGYAKISHLVLGSTPDSLVGSSSIK